MKRSSILAVPCLLVVSAGYAAAQNLLMNPSGQSGPTVGWTIIESGGDGWGSSGQSADGDNRCFITSFNWCTRSQTIDLIAAGFTESFLDSSPPIRARESFKGFAPQNSADFYFLRVELRDENGAVLDSWQAGTQAAPLVADGNWRVEEHLFENYPPGVRQIYWEDGGDDAEFWLGHYGTLIDGAELFFADPAPTAINLDPGTYPVSAPAGGVAGVFSAVDNPGSDHTFELVSETQPVVLVPLGSDWAYLDDGSNQGAAWTGEGFDDASWQVGAAQLGYGEGDETTVIAGQGTHFTNYFRHEFDVPAATLTNLESLSLRLKRDDGAVVYLNGVEVARDNLAPGPVAFDTAATNATDDGQAFHSFEVPLERLEAGPNVLAVEVHQVNLTSSDTSFDLELVAEQVSNSYENRLFTIDGDRLLFAQAGPDVPITVGLTGRVNVQATDDAGNTLVQLLEVTVVEDPTQAPTAIAVSPAFVTEGQAAGVRVGFLSATDADPGDFHTFELVPGAGSADNTKFSIESDRLAGGVVFDVAAQATHSIRVRATDRAGLSFEQSLTIEVRDVNDPPTDIGFTGISIAIGDPAGTLVGVLTTEDADIGDAHTYSFVPTAGTETVFDFGSEWRFLDDGSDLGGVNWTAPGAGFDDSAWKVGRGSFGYGDAQNTPVDFGGDDLNKRITTYFRREFVLASPEIYDGLQMQILRDDGVAVYLNGTEVGRDGLDPGAGAADLATATIGAPQETTPITIDVPAAMFVPGSNTFAAEVHQAAVDSSDLTFDLELVGATDASGAAYFDIVNGNEVRANANFENAGILPGTSLGLTIRSTDAAGDSAVRTFPVFVSSGDQDDVDGDGLPDAWELQYFPTITGQHGGSDSDGDGDTDFQEYVYDNSPIDEESMQLVRIQRSGADAHIVGWTSNPTRLYRLQMTSSLAGGPWVDAPGGVRIGTGANMVEIVPDGVEEERHFRVLVEVP